MIPEFIGRLPIICPMDSLTQESYVKILREPKNAILKQYQKLLELDGIRLTFEEEAVREIARQSIERKTGARGLRAIIENCMMDYMFELPSREDVKECRITKAVVDKEGNPELIGQDDQVILLEEKTGESA